MSLSFLVSWCLPHCSFNTVGNLFQVGAFWHSVLVFCGHFFYGVLILCCAAVPLSVFLSACALLSRFSGARSSGARKLFCSCVSLSLPSLEQVSMLDGHGKKMAPSSRGVAWLRDGLTALVVYFVMRFSLSGVVGAAVRCQATWQCSLCCCHDVLFVAKASLLHFYLWLCLLQCCVVLVRRFSGNRRGPRQIVPGWEVSFLTLSRQVLLKWPR